MAMLRHVMQFLTVACEGPYRAVSAIELEPEAWEALRKEVQDVDENQVWTKSGEPRPHFIVLGIPIVRRG